MTTKKPTHLLALDQGTSSSRSIVFDANGGIVAMAQAEFRQIYPRPGWVEHDPKEILQSQLATAREALAKAGLQADDIASIGITNQRETTLVWNRATGEPIYNAIVWQDRRAEPTCAALRDFDYREVKVARAILDHSREVWVATDHSKFNRPAMVEMARFDQIEMLFTDGLPPEPFPALLAQAGVTLVNCNDRHE